MTKFEILFELFAMTARFAISAHPNSDLMVFNEKIIRKMTSDLL